MAESIEQKIKLPAVGLIITGILNILVGVYCVLSMIVQVGMGELDKTFPSQAEKIGYYGGFFGVAFLGVLGLAVAPLIIYGAVQMMNGKKYGLARTVSVLAVLPATSCCCLFGVPVGVWAFITLSDPMVKSYFNGDSLQPNLAPPGPPQF